MNRAEHFEAAERELALVEREIGRMDPAGDVLAEWAVRLQVAQVHATLATSELTPMPAPARTLVKQHPLCSCPVFPETHLWGASCPRPAAEQVAAADQARAERSTGRLVEAVDEPLKVTCTCAGNGEHERGVFVGCLWTPVPSDGPGQ